MSARAPSSTDPAARKYGRLAERYDERWSFYVEASIRETLKRLPARPGDAVLDVACGTGALLERLAVSTPGLRLAGIDPSPQMLRIARRRLGPDSRLILGRAEELPFAARSFQLVVSTNSFHYFRRPEAAVGEMARVVVRGGRVVITDWCDDFLACKLCDLALRVLDRAYVRAYGRRECRDVLERARLGEVQVEPYKISRLWGLMTAIGRRAA